MAALAHLRKTALTAVTTIAAALGSEPAIGAGPALGSGRAIGAGPARRISVSGPGSSPARRPGDDPGPGRDGVRRAGGRDRAQRAVLVWT
ncbi:hypothetical protein [Streptomyces sp. NPDC089799]|uniref:hypothetical protein n=1 Tax=Streptomyces sp. NPDC089799 TaxID=3155066 RepID=UPI00343D0074